MLSYQFALPLICIYLSVCNTKKTNALNGQHLRVIAMEYPVALTTERNSTGHVVCFDGGLKQFLLALSEMFQFSYSLLPLIAPLMEDSQATKGSLSYLMNNEADFLLGVCVATPYSFKYADFPASWYYSDINCIVPYPREKLDITASLKPLSYEVWITVIATGLIAIICLHISIKNECPKRNLRNKSGDIWRVTHFVLRNLVSQGQVCNSSQLAFRIAAGAWCCGCFFLVQIYCSTLTSHLTSPNQKPIATSVEELVNTPGLSFTVQRNYGIDVSLQTAKYGKLFKKLAASINEDPEFRCNKSTDCLAIVQKGYAGFGAPINTLKFIMDEDLKTTGNCHYYMMKDAFLRLSAFTPLHKNSPYTETMSIGILRIHQAGLTGLWESWYVPTPWKCMEINRRNEIPRISIGNFSGAFIILLIGYIFGFVAFGFENIKFNYHFTKS